MVGDLHFKCIVFANKGLAQRCARFLCNVLMVYIQICHNPSIYCGWMCAPLSAYLRCFNNMYEVVNIVKCVLKLDNCFVLVWYKKKSLFSVFSGLKWTNFGRFISYVMCNLKSRTQSSLLNFFITKSKMLVQTIQYTKSTFNTPWMISFSKHEQQYLMSFHKHKKQISGFILVSKVIKQLKKQTLCNLLYFKTHI